MTPAGNIIDMRSTFRALQDEAFNERLEARRVRIKAMLKRLTDARDNAPIPERPCDVSVEAE